jgi:putative iron-dependent peroxidase
MTTPQPGILAPLPDHARYLTFTLGEMAKVAAALAALRELADGESTVVGVGQTLAALLHAHIDGLKSCPPTTAPGLSIEIAPEVLWIWLRGNDRGELLHRSRKITAALSSAFVLNDIVDAFKHADGRDLSGFEDGTENPTGDAAVDAAVVGDGPLAGSSFVAAQRWQHDFARLAAMSQQAQDHAIGRRLCDNEELEDAPVCAHVKRTAQESFSPEAFVVRRSMPWADGNDGGLLFVAFGNSFDAFEAQLKRMVGGEDGVTDALFTFTRPLTAAYYWCPALKDGKLDLAPLGI